jgi:hypothetical protein
VDDLWGRGDRLWQSELAGDVFAGAGYFAGKGYWVAMNSRGNLPF